jgi:hypothetical protein
MLGQSLARQNWEDQMAGSDFESHNAKIFASAGLLNRL